MTFEEQWALCRDGLVSSPRYVVWHRKNGGQWLAGGSAWTWDAAAKILAERYGGAGMVREMGKPPAEVERAKGA